MDITEALLDLIKGQRGHRHGTIKKTVPMRKEWKAKMKELMELENEIENKKGRYDALHKSFWADIKLSLNDFSHMSYNPKTEEIELWDDNDPEEKGVKSPIQRESLGK